MNLNDSISVVLGVGPQRVKVLNGLGVENIKDMLYYFPRRYLDRTTLTPIKDLKKGDQVTLISKVETLGERGYVVVQCFRLLLQMGQDY